MTAVEPILALLAVSSPDFGGRIAHLGSGDFRFKTLSSRDAAWALREWRVNAAF
jgi:hypothetical protein